MAGFFKYREHDLKDLRTILRREKRRGLLCRGNDGEWRNDWSGRAYRRKDKEIFSRAIESLINAEGYVSAIDKFVSGDIDRAQFYRLIKDMWVDSLRVETDERRAFDAWFAEHKEFPDFQD